MTTTTSNLLTPTTIIRPSRGWGARRFLHRRQLEGAYGDRFPRGIPHLHSLFYILEHAIDWLQDELIRAPEPFFGYVHVLPPHEPYFARRDFVDRFADGWAPAPKEPCHFSEGHSDAFRAQQRREYDEYLAYADRDEGPTPEDERQAPLVLRASSFLLHRPQQPCEPMSSIAIEVENLGKVVYGA